MFVHFLNTIVDHVNNFLYFLKDESYIKMSKLPLCCTYGLLVVEDTELG